MKIYYEAIFPSSLPFAPKQTAQNLLPVVKNFDQMFSNSLEFKNHCRGRQKNKEGKEKRASSIQLSWLKKKKPASKRELNPVQKLPP